MRWKRLSDSEIRIVFYVLNNNKVNGGRKFACAVHAAHWVQLENIVSTSFLLQQVWLVEHVGDFDIREDNMKVVLRENEFGVDLSGLR